MNKTHIAIGFVIGFVAMMGILIGSNEPSDKIGSLRVYEHIDNITDCEELQKEFDTAMDNAESRQPGDELRKISLSYATYADERMRTIGCY